MKKILKKTVSALLNILLISVTLVCAVVMIKTAAKKDASIFGCRMFYIVTGSMEPTIPVGASVIVKAEPSGSYRVGDIITFEASQAQIKGQPNTHRIVAVNRDGDRTVYVTKGDANNMQDAEPVYPENIYGKVIWNSGSTKWLGTVMGLITTPMGFFTCIILPVMAIAGIYIRDFAKSYKEEVEKAAKEAAEAAQQAAEVKEEKEE